MMVRLPFADLNGDKTPPLAGLFAGRRRVGIRYLDVGLTLT